MGTHASCLLGLLLLVAGIGPCARTRAGEGDGARVEHVVLVVLGGGVRGRDMADLELMPTLAAMAAAKDGRLLADLAADAPDGYAATARLLTGRDDGPDGVTRARPAHPTLCEYVRAARGLPREKVWYVSFAGGDDLALAHSEHVRYGEAAAPAVAWGRGAFAEPLSAFLETFGRPLPVEPEAWSHLRRLRGLGRGAVEGILPDDVDAGLPRAEAVERALLRELDRKALLLDVPNPRDEQALRAARTVIEVHAPELLVVRLGEAEQAQASFQRYRAVLAANDGGIRRLLAAIEAEPRMAGRTLFVVVGDRGRNEEPDADGVLGADDGSARRGRVALVIRGPGVRRRGPSRVPRSVADVCPTLARALGADAPHATGHPWEDLFVAR